MQSDVQPEMQGTRSPQPPTRGHPARARGTGWRLATRTWATIRLGVLVVLTGTLVAAVIATVFGAIVIAINGHLP